MWYPTTKQFVDFVFHFIINANLLSVLDPNRLVRPCIPVDQVTLVVTSGSFDEILRVSTHKEEKEGTGSVLGDEGSERRII